MIRARDNEAVAALRKVVQITLSPESTLSPDPLDQPEMPSVEFRMVTARLLVELREFKNGVRVLDSVVQENDENPEAWYLLAFCHFHLKKFKNAKECLRNVRTTALKLKLVDPELRAGAEELFKSVLEALGENQESEEERPAAEDDDDFETVSEEDISADEEMKD